VEVGSFPTNLETTRLDKADVEIMFKRMQSSKSAGPSGLCATLLKNNNRRE